MLATLKAKARFLAATPLHPQWLLRRNTALVRELIAGAGANRTVLDIGCFSKWARGYLPPGCDYVGLDYYQTASEWYRSVPDVYGDALALPLAGDSFDVVLLLDVLEHIEDAGELLAQIQRVLKPGGRLLMSVPFLYPIHDAPRDFLRPTRYGLDYLAGRSGLALVSCTPVGTPLVTAALLANIALAKTAINWWLGRRVWVLLAAVFPLLILVNNLLARALSGVEPADDFMANSYHVVMVKPQPAAA